MQTEFKVLTHTLNNFKKYPQGIIKNVLGLHVKKLILRQKHCKKGKILVFVVNTGKTTVSTITLAERQENSCKITGIILAYTPALNHCQIKTDKRGWRSTTSYRTGIKKEALHFLNNRKITENMRLVPMHNVFSGSRGPPFSGRG